MTDSSLKKIASELRKARLANGMTQAEVAQKAGIGTNRYAVIERGEAQNITIKTLKDIVKALGVKGSDILPF